MTTDTEAHAIKMAAAAVLDPKVAAYRATYYRALDLYKGGACAGGPDVARKAMEQAKGAWQKALREFCAEYEADA